MRDAQGQKHRGGGEELLTHLARQGQPLASAMLLLASLLALLQGQLGFPPLQGQQEGAAVGTILHSPSPGTPVRLQQLHLLASHRPESHWPLA